MGDGLPRSNRTQPGLQPSTMSGDPFAVNEVMLIVGLWIFSMNTPLSNFRSVASAMINFKW